MAVKRAPARGRVVIVEAAAQGAAIGGVVGLAVWLLSKPSVRQLVGEVVANLARPASPASGDLSRKYPKAIDVE